MAQERILVVDDDRAILRLISTILKREHYDVDTAGGGSEALAKMEVTSYDAIVLDLMMPDVSGLDVLRVLHTRPLQVTCVVLLSAASSFEIASSITPDVFAALRKPFDITELTGTIRDCLDSRCTLRRALQESAPAA